PDQLGILGLITGEGLEELARAGLGDGADVFDDLGTAHADAVVGNGNGALVLVEGDVDLEVGVPFVQGIVGEGSKAQFMRRIRSVGNQFAQEDLLVGVQGVDHQVQQLPNLGLEVQSLLMGFNAHRSKASTTNLFDAPQNGVRNPADSRARSVS